MARNSSRGTANSAWEPGAGNSGPGNFEWDIGANSNGLNGDGIGILKGQTFDSFCIAVPDGTLHGLVSNAWVHTWTRGGALEQPNAVQADLVYGLVSAPIPEPATSLLAALGIAGALICRRHLASRQ